MFTNAKENISLVDCPTTAEGREEMRNTLYREAVGAMLWASTVARPHIADAVRCVTRSHENPGQAHWGR